MDRAFTWPCALWVRQVAASSTGPPTWATRCCYRRCRHRSICCRREACRHIHTHTHTHHFLHMDEYVPKLQENAESGAELQDKTITVRARGSCQSDIYQQTSTEPTVTFKTPVNVLNMRGFTWITCSAGVLALLVAQVRNHNCKITTETINIFFSASQIRSAIIRIPQRGTSWLKWRSVLWREFTVGLPFCTVHALAKRLQPHLRCLDMCRSTCTSRDSAPPLPKAPNYRKFKVNLNNPLTCNSQFFVGLLR